MNSLATSTRQSSRTITSRSPVRPFRLAAGRIARWWNDDTVSAHLASAREHDQALLRRVR